MLARTQTVLWLQEKSTPTDGLGSTPCLIGFYRRRNTVAHGLDISNGCSTA
jgi:hypothetical protein